MEFRKTEDGKTMEQEARDSVQMLGAVMVFGPLAWAGIIALLVWAC